LIRSEKALNLVNRLTGTDATDYKIVKQYLMCESLIVDRVKAILNESVLKYVLTAESNTVDKSWLSSQ